MNNVRSVVQRTMHLQLQHFAHFRAPVLLFAGLVVFSGFSIAGSVSSVTALSTALKKALTKSRKPEGVPLLYSLFDIFTRALNTAYLRVRIHIKVLIQWQAVFSRGQGGSQNDDTYPTPRAEAKYWHVAGRYRRRLYSGSDITSIPSKTTSALIPLVTYYTPRLLPLYRDRSSAKPALNQADTDTRECRVSPRTFCKWHRMVFQGSCHPTLTQAAMQMKYYSNRDLREIQRIARLLPDEQVFRSKGTGSRKPKGMTKYSEMWKGWLENKEIDLVIVFE